MTNLRYSFNKILKRSKSSHKYDFGHLLIIGGSKLYSGSPALAGLAALRTGVDQVTILAPKRTSDIIASFSPDLICYPLEGEYLSEKNLKDLFSFSDNKDAVVIGGGLTRNDEILKTVLKYLGNIDLPMVLDADALHAVAKDLSILKDKKFILTPHLFEFKVLTGQYPQNLEDKKSQVLKAAQKLEGVILLKGNLDVISNGQNLSLNFTGNPYMSVGGTGDTLAGICGALLAMKIEPFQAAVMAAYLNGKAGDLAAKKFKAGLLASDIISEIPNVLR